MNKAREALTNAVNRAIANGAPVYTEIKPSTTQEDTIKRTLNRFQEKNTAAFSDGDFVYTTSGKYDARNGLQLINELSITGFERNLGTWADDGKWFESCTWNEAAEQHRQTWQAKRDAEQARREAEQIAERERTDREYQELCTERARIDALAANLKGKQQTITLASSSDVPLAPVKAWTYGGIAVHKSNAYKNPYTLTHINSGFSFGLQFDSLKSAKTAVARLLELADYSTLTDKQVVKVSGIVDLLSKIRHEGGR